MARPAGKSVKFLSYNSTGMNKVKSKWIRDLMDTCGVSYCGVQEHFKKIKMVGSYFKTLYNYTLVFNLVFSPMNTNTPENAENLPKKVCVFPTFAIDR